MYKAKTEKEIRCPLEYGLSIFGGKWKCRIICILDDYGKLRYSSLHKELATITDTVLAATLKEMAADEIIMRMQFNEIPPRVEYSLTEKGKSVIPILRSICRWSGAYHFNEHPHSLTQCKTCIACQKHIKG